jgi:hypothetical protein
MPVARTGTALNVEEPFPNATQLLTYSVATAHGYGTLDRHLHKAVAEGSHPPPNTTPSGLTSSPAGWVPRQQPGDHRETGTSDSPPRSPAIAKKGTGYREPAPFSACMATCELLHKQHLAIRRHRPVLVRRDHLDLVTGLAQLVHRRHDVIPHVFRLPFRRRAFVAQKLV